MAVMIVPIDRWRSVFAESIGLEADDICDTCHDDEKYDDYQCIGCIEEELEEEE
jgi:hypothetical protein